MSDELKQEQKGIFGITKETKDKNNAPILVATEVEKSSMFPSGWKFPIANLVNVTADPKKEKKDGSTTAVVQFVFKDKDGRQYVHIEWELDTADSKFTDKLEWMKTRIKHIYTSIFGDFPATGIGETASSFAEFFNMVSDAFNSRVTEDKQKIYPKIDLFIKLVYYKKRLGFPLSPNFLERYIKGQPCKLLTIDPSYDKLAPQSGGASGGGLPGIGGGGMEGLDDLPNFENGFN